MALMARPLAVDLKQTPVLCWRWRVDDVLQKADMTKKSGDDYAARVYVALKLPPQALGLGLRAKLALARSIYGDHVPDAAGPADRYPPRFTVHRLGRRGARVGYPVRPAVRGAYRIGPLRGRGTDALGLAEFRHDLLPADRLLVLPRVTPLTGRPALTSTAAGRGAEVDAQGSPSHRSIVARNPAGHRAISARRGRRGRG